jgi:hypothetical protein
MDVSQKNIRIQGDGKLVAGDDNSVTKIHHGDEYHNHTSTAKTKLSSLFAKLKEQYESKEESSMILEELNRYLTDRDTIGLEQKLEDGNLSYLYEDAIELKEAYAKKVYKYQLYTSAQEIHSYLLGVICSKFRHIIYPMIKEGKSHLDVNKAISEAIIDPVCSLIIEHGCDDIMGLCPQDIEGMIYFLTGRCHIKWRV